MQLLGKNGANGYSSFWSETMYNHGKPPLGFKRTLHLRR